ncbi:MAG: hypothetical protein PHI12_11340 [Dehalococcoidales bacterium]|nr:hypothetical protein [Dehalococcoidales bacterium]
MSEVWSIIMTVVAVGALIISLVKNKGSDARATLIDDRVVNDRINKVREDLSKQISQVKDDLKKEVIEVKDDINNRFHDYEIKQEHRITEIEGKIGIFWQDFNKKMAGLIHSPHTPETDLLLDKVVAGTITKQEALDLCAKIQGHIEKKEYPPEKVPAAIALVVSLCAGA